MHYPTVADLPEIGSLPHGLSNRRNQRLRLHCSCTVVVTHLGPEGVEQVPAGESMPSSNHDQSSRDQFTAAPVELTIRLGVLGLLLYLPFILLRPFIRSRSGASC